MLNHIPTQLDSQITKLKCPSWYLGNWLILHQPISKISGDALLPLFPPPMVPKPSPVILGVPKQKLPGVAFGWYPKPGKPPCLRSDF